MPLEIKNISKSFNEKSILKDLSLLIYDNEFVVFLGPSGCGKTTLLRIIAGLEKQDTGEIYFNNELISNREPKDRSIGMVFQNYALYPHLTVYENIAFPLKVNRINKVEIDKIVKDIADFIGLTEYLNHKPKQLSGGQKQRVALGRAISRNPKIFLFDEPLSNLDAKLRSTMRFELYQLHKKLDTISIYVTHDQVEAMTMGDRIVVMNDGIIQQVDTPKEIYEKPANRFVASFIGNPQINFFDAVYDSSQKTINLRKEAISYVLDFDRNVNVTLGIRPENIVFNYQNEDFTKLGEVRIHSIEYLGNESIIYFEYENEIRTLLTKDNNEIKIGEKYTIYTKKNNILIFDENNKLIGK